MFHNDALTPYVEILAVHTGTAPCLGGREAEKYGPRVQPRRGVEIVLSLGLVARYLARPSSDESPVPSGPLEGFCSLRGYA